MRYVGDYVITPNHTDDNDQPHAGRVHKIHPHGCPESELWVASQRNLGDNPMQYKNERWVSILLNSGAGRAGSICVPDTDLFVQRVEPFEFAHRDADLYFEDA